MASTARLMTKNTESPTRTSLSLQPTELQPQEAASLAPIADLIGELSTRTSDGPLVARAILALSAIGHDLASLRTELEALRQERS